jgi:hypothetical protein
MMELAPINLTVPNVVIGWSEEAVAFANKKNYHLIVNDTQRPFVHLFRNEDVKSEWYRNIFELGMKSKLPVPFDIQTVAIEDGNIKVITRQNTKILIDFKFVHIFDLENCHGFGLDQVIDDHIVTDLFDITAGSRLCRDIIIKPRDAFVKEFRTVRSNRIDRNTTGDFKDFIAKSIISDKDIRGFDFSETVVRLVLERKLKKLEIKQPNGRSLKIEHNHRHSMKNSFRIDKVEDIDARIIVHERN